jgi:DNA polymerase delta subunit 3
MRTQHQQNQPPVQKQQPAQKPTTPTLETKPAKSMFASNKTAAKPAPKNTISSAKSTPDSSQASTQTSTKPAATKTAPLKREGSSLFKAFAKARPKAQDQTESSAEPSPAVDSKATEDGKDHLECVLMQDLTNTVDPMDGLSDEEADDEDTAMLDDGALTETGGKSKKEREDELRRMMDMEGKNHLIPLYHSCLERLTRCRTDEPMVDAPAKTTTADASEDAEDEPDSKSEAQTKPEPEETVTVSDGRRRGRRRVMKKKTVQDEEGYLGISQLATSTLTLELTIIHSNTRRSCLGVFLRRRACDPKGKGLGCTHHCKGQEGCCSKGTGKHHVVLL